MPPPRRIRVALVGTGHWARTCHAPAILQSSGFHLRALWSRTQANAERFNYEVAGRSLEVYYGEEGFELLLKRADIEGFVVALPPEVQPLYARRILEHHRHLFSEGPIATNREKAAETLQFYEALQRSMGTGAWFISEPLPYEQAFQPDAIDWNCIGPILSAEAHAVLGPRRPSFVMEGVRYASILRQLLGDDMNLGPVVEVNCTHQLGGSTDGDTDILSGTMKFEKGVVCALNWRTATPQMREGFCIQVWGLNGSLRWEPESTSSSSGASPAALRRYVVTRKIGGGGFERPLKFESTGASRQLEVWGRAIHNHGRSQSSSGKAPCTSERIGRGEDRGASSPLLATIDLAVVTAMLQSQGSPVLIREEEKPGR